MRKLEEQFNRLEKKLDLALKPQTHQHKKLGATYREASEYFGITVEGLKSRIKRGQIRRITNNNRPLIPYSEIERFIKSQNPGIVI